MEWREADDSQQTIVKACGDQILLAALIKLRFRLQIVLRTHVVIQVESEAERPA